MPSTLRRLLLVGALGSTVLVTTATAMFQAAGQQLDEVPASAARPLIVLTGRESDVTQPRWRRAASQEVFDEEWTAHMGDRVQRAAQGWPMPPQIDFGACEAIFIFGGDGKNANGYRVEQMIDEPDALTIRYERISYQTASLEGPDHGVDVRPWAVMLVPRTDRTILLEENVQGLIGGPPKWKQRAAFPG